MDEQLKRNIAKTIELLRGNLAVDEYHVILFLISLQREGLLNRLDTYDPLERRFKFDELIERDLLAHNERFEELYDKIYGPIIQNIPFDAFTRITNLILGIDLTRSFSSTFDHFLSYFVELSGKSGSFFQTPNQIADFAYSLVHLPSNAKVYNPFAGLSSFGILRKEGQDYFGQEINTRAWAIGLLRLYAYDILPDATFSNESSIQNWYPRFDGDFSSFERLLKTGSERRRDVDLIISSPPFGYRSPYLEQLFGKKYTAELFLLEQGLEILSEGGKIVCLVSNGRLSSSGYERDFRQSLIQKDYLEMVISFPGSLLQNTSVPFSIIVINKDKRLKDAVKFVDASSFIAREKRNWTFSYKKLLKDIHADVESEAIKILSSSRIEQEDFNISVNRYFVEEFNGVSVGELGEIFATSTAVEKVGHLINTQWLRVDPLNYLIPNNFVSYEQLPKSCRQIAESCFLISTTGGKLKVGYFNYEGIPFYISSDIFPFRLVTHLVIPEYFVYQLLSKSTLDQLRSYTSGSAIQRVSKSDFLRLKLDIPSIENTQSSLLHQQSVLKGARNAYIHSREKELESERQLLGLKEEASRNFQSMKHTFRQFLSSLKSNTLGTKKFLELNEGKPISLDMLYSKNLGQDLGTHLQNVDALIVSLSNLLEDEPEQAKSEILNLTKFVASFQQKFTFDNKFSYRLIIDNESFLDLESSTLLPLIDFNKQQLEKLFSNVVSNAINHGFKEDKDYFIDFIVRADEQQIILEIRNNGRPMPSGFGFKDLITRGEKSVDSNGTGLGGAEIKSIAELNKCVFELDSNPEETFPVTYRIKFPLAVR